MKFYNCLHNNYRTRSLCQNSINFICENLTTTIEKLDISRQRFFGDEQLLTLLKRCNKLTEFSFGFTSVSDTSVDTIITTLSQTLIKINPSHLISFPKLLQIAKMPKLKVLSNTAVITSYLKDEKLEIASPSHLLIVQLFMHLVDFGKSKENLIPLIEVIRHSNSLRF